MKETASQIQDCMTALCRHCGELSLATAANLLSLRDTPEVNSEGQQDTRIKVKVKYDDEVNMEKQIFMVTFLMHWSLVSIPLLKICSI